MRRNRKNTTGKLTLRQVPDLLRQAYQDAKSKPTSPKDFLVLCALFEGMILGYMLGAYYRLPKLWDTVFIVVSISLMAASLLLYLIYYYRARHPGESPAKRFLRYARFNVRGYLWNTRKFFLAVCGCFALAVLFGFLYCAASPSNAELGYSFTDKALDGAPQERNGLVMTAYYIANNGRVGLTESVLGSVTLGLLSLWGNTLNGVVMGVVLFKIMANYGISQGLYLFTVCVTPHGILELPAIFLAASLGVRTAWGQLQAIAYHTRYRIMDNLVKVLVVYCLVVLPLLCAAAVVEAFFTPWLIYVLGVA